MNLFQKKRQGATLAGIFSMALGSALLLCGAGPTPTGNVQNADVNANSYSLTNAATLQAANVYANNVVATNSLTVPTSFVLATGHGGTGTSAPGLIAGTNVVVTGSFPNQTVSATSPAWELKSSTFTAVAGHKYQIDTSSGAVTVTMPASASAMDSIEFADATLSWGTNAVTLSRNGLKINNGTSNYTDSVEGDKLSIVYISSGYGWSVK